MAFEVVATAVAARQVATLRGPRLSKYLAFERDLANRGCAAMGYRLTGAAPLPHLCVKHLRGTDRAVVAFVGDQAWVALVGPHNSGDLALDVYTQLYESLGLEPPTGTRTKPPCCGANGEPPVLDEPVLDVFDRT